MADRPPEKKDLSVRPVDLKIALTVLRDGGKVESCCNYDVAGNAGNLLLVLPPMTHIQDMPR